MSSKILFVIGSGAMLSSCVSSLHNHINKSDYSVILVEEQNMFEADFLETYCIKNYADSLQTDYIKLISENENLVEYFYKTQHVAIKREKVFLLLNNKSLYVGHSPVLNKNDSYFTNKLNIINCRLLLNKERPHIRSPGVSI